MGVGTRWLRGCATGQRGFRNGAVFRLSLGLGSGIVVRMRIFDKLRLGPGQLRTVADERFGDADALRQTCCNARANGAMYLGGFVIECLLKASLLEKYSWLRSATSLDGRTGEEKRLWSLCYRSHDLDEILAKLPEIQDRLSRLEQQGSRRLNQTLKSICARWTIYARYSPYKADIDDARTFLDQIKELKKCLK